MTESASAENFAYAFQELPGKDVETLIGSIPTRWGRMSPLSRAVVVEAGRFLTGNDLLATGSRFSDMGKTVGLIGVTGNGSLSTDVSFANTLADGFLMASPAIFGYTLPNIPLAEAANHYGLTGPVYALFNDHDPMEVAVKEAKRWLDTQADLSLMLVCIFDSSGDQAAGSDFIVSFNMVRRKYD
ncbi:MAG: hypothetical protein OEL55_06280 [Desulfobulbaceae bacterium]|nr:hypothetical protein [Desulfobulbaceae bacterium]